MFALLLLLLSVIGGGLSAPVLRRDDSTAVLELLFDPSLLKQYVGLTDDYGEKPLPLPPPPPDTGNLYKPNLEDEYY
ncbi:hypothetical protein PAMP_000192 [Pampus punctatissimus]